MTVAALILELNMLLALAGATLALMRSDPVPGRLAYSMLALAGAVWCAGELLIERGGLDSWAGMRLAMLGVVLVGPYWFALSVQLAGLPLARRVPWLAAGFALPGLVLWSLLFVQPWSALVMSGPRSPGALWWPYTIYTYGLVLAGAAILAWTALRSSGLVRKAQRLGIALSGLFAMGVHAAYHWFDAPWPYDPTPLALTPVGASLATALFPGGLLDVRPLVQQELIDRLPLGVVIADRGGAVLDVNPLAEQVLALTRAEAIGRALDAIVAETPKEFRAEVQTVRRASRVLGKIAFLHPTDGAHAGGTRPPR